MQKQFAAEKQQMEEEHAKAIEAAKQGAIETLGAQMYSQLMERFADLRQGIAKDIAQVLATFIGEKFLSFNPNVWKDEQNLYALLIYLFNGGNSSVVHVILKSYGQGVIAENIMTGVLAYLSHKQEVFFNTFAKLTDEDIQSIPPALFFSIVLSTVGNTIIKDPVFAMKQLDQVRLFSPGTLFEESAIRREIKVATILGKMDLLALLVRNPARLYYAASLASSVTAHEAEQLLQNISCKDLSKKDRLLFIAAQAVAQKVTSSLVDGQKEVKIQDSTQPQNQKELDTMSKKAVQQQNAPSSTSTGINQLIEQAQEKINEVDKLLGT